MTARTPEANGTNGFDLQDQTGKLTPATGKSSVDTSHHPRISTEAKVGLGLTMATLAFTGALATEVNASDEEGGGGVGVTATAEATEVVNGVEVIPVHGTVLLRPASNLRERPSTSSQPFYVEDSVELETIGRVPDGQTVSGSSEWYVVEVPVDETGNPDFDDIEPTATFTPSPTPTAEPTRSQQSGSRSRGRLTERYFVHSSRLLRIDTDANASVGTPTPFPTNTPFELEPTATNTPRPTSTREVRPSSTPMEVAQAASPTFEPSPTLQPSPTATSEGVSIASLPDASIDLSGDGLVNYESLQRYPEQLRFPRVLDNEGERVNITLDLTHAAELRTTDGNILQLGVYRDFPNLDARLNRFPTYNMAYIAGIVTDITENDGNYVISVSFPNESTGGWSTVSCNTCSFYNVYSKWTRANVSSSNRKSI
jgi:hypothetical protein